MAMITAGAKTFLEAAGRVLAFWQKHQKADSLISFSQTTRVEPICIIDKRALPVPYLPDVLQTTNSLFAAYYLQAAALKCDIGDIRAGKILSSLNPERPFLESLNPALETLVGTPYAAENDYRFRLPKRAVGATESLSLSESFQASMEMPVFSDNFSEEYNEGIRRAKEKGAAAADSVGKVAGHVAAANAAVRDAQDAIDRGGNAEVKEDVRHHGTAMGNIDSSLNKSFTEAANLAVGRMYNVTLSKGQDKATIPVMIRLITVECASDLLVHILSDGARAYTSTRKERWFGFKLGELKFWRDIVFCQDLIDEHKKALLKDHTGIYKTILNRRAGNAAAAAVSGEPSVGTASNIAVITRETVRELENEIKGKLSNFETRQKLFEMSYLMILVVLDSNYDHITFYHRGIALPTELSVKNVQSANKGAGVDVGDVLKQLMVGTAPSF